MKLDSSTVHGRKKTWRHKEPGTSPSDKGAVARMRFYTRCPEGRQKPGSGAPDRPGTRGRVLGRDCKHDTWEPGGFNRGEKAAAAEGRPPSPLWKPLRAPPLPFQRCLQRRLEVQPPRRMERFSGRRAMVTGAGKGSVPGAAPLEQPWCFGDEPRGISVTSLCSPLQGSAGLWRYG